MKKENRKFNRLKITLFILLGIAFVPCLIIYLIFFHEINTILSIKKINNLPVYEMNYHGDYALDKYLITGSKDYFELADFLNENLLKGIPKYYYQQFECSSFYAQTPEGDYILARNLDTEETIPFILRTNSSDGYQTIGMANLLNLGWNDRNIINKLSALSGPYFTFDGMNEYGVAVASLSVPTGSSSKVDDSKITIYDYTVDRITIDKAKNVEEAIKLLSNYNIKMEEKYPSQYMIGDREGNCVLLEYIDGEMQVIDKSGSYQIATNLLLYNNEKVVGYSSDRYRRFEEVLSQTDGIISTEDALELLEANTASGEAQWSVVYNLTKKTMSVEFYGDYENTYTYNIE